MISGWCSTAPAPKIAFLPYCQKRKIARPRNSHFVMLLRSMNPFGGGGAGSRRPYPESSPRSVSAEAFVAKSTRRQRLGRGARPALREVAAARGGFGALGSRCCGSDLLVQ